MIDISDIPTLTPDDRRLIELLRRESNDWTRKCFESALMHLVYAHRLADVDPGMAVFRAITAEEEAATGLLRALRLRKYPKSEQLRFRDHVHKAAVYPFILAIAKHASYLKFNGIREVRLGIPKSEDRPRLAVALVLDGALEGQIARPVPPLNFSYREGDDQSLPNYRRYFLEVVGPSGVVGVRKYLEEKANERNLILYASSQGLPKCPEVPEGYLSKQKHCVITILKATLLTWPYAENQQFVQEGIDAFLSVTEKLQRDAAQEQGG